jgi:hypothetical protein
MCPTGGAYLALKSDLGAGAVIEKLNEKNLSFPRQPLFELEANDVTRTWTMADIDYRVSLQVDEQYNAARSSTASPSENFSFTGQDEIEELLQEISNYKNLGAPFF